MKNLPPDISLDFVPTEKTLWVMWVQAPLDQVESGWAEPVYYRWGLASEGDIGLQEIKKGWGEEFLAAVPFGHIRAARNILQDTSSLSLASLWPSWLPQIKAASFSLRKTETGQVEWGFGEGADNGPPNENILEGRVSDFEELFQEGERILAESDYKVILSDSRPVSPGHPLDWLHFMKSPERWGPARSMMESWNEQ